MYEIKQYSFKEGRTTFVEFGVFKIGASKATCPVVSCNTMEQAEKMLIKYNAIAEKFA